MTTTTNALPVVVVSEAHAECKRALLQSMYAWAFNREAQADVCIEVGRERCVPDWLIARVHGRRNWYLIPNVSTYPTIADYIYATRAALDTDVRAYQAEDAAFEAAHRKRRREALKAERAAAVPPAPERAQPPRESKRARASA
jgi:hypothetical protein